MAHYRGPSRAGGRIGRWNAAHSRRKDGPIESLAPYRIYMIPAFVALATFANTLANGVTYDDKWTLAAVQELAGMPGWTFLWSNRGLTYAVHLFDNWLWGSWVPGFHITNVILHSLASSLAAYGARVITGSRIAAVFCGLLFAVHPVHTEVVASIAYRKDILAMIFVVLALVFWLSARRWLVRLFGTLLCFCLAMLSKEVAAVSLPLMLFAADLLDLPRNGRPPSLRVHRTGLILVPGVVLSVAAVLRFGGNIADHFTPERIWYVTENQVGGYWDVLAASMSTTATVLKLLFFPVTLSADYPVPRLEDSGWWVAAAGGILIVGWVLAALAVRRRSAAVTFAMLWTLLMYVPCSNVVPLTSFFVADRYLYVPSFGICLLFGLAVRRCGATSEERRWGGFRYLGMSMALLTVLAGGLRSAVRARDWRDSDSLWSSALRAGVNTWRVHSYLGSEQLRRGEIEGALKHLSEARRINPNISAVRNNLGSALLAQGRVDEALAEFSAAVRLHSSSASAHANLGRALDQQRKYEEAVREYRAALAIRGDHVPALKNLAGLLAACPERRYRDRAEAIRLARRACELTEHRDPRLLYILAVALSGPDHAEEAGNTARQALALAQSSGSVDLADRIRRAMESFIDEGQPPP